MALENIPHEPRYYRQWACYDANKAPLNPHTGKYANVRAPDTWGSFDEACAGVTAGRGVGIGFVLTEQDPYSIIDLDVREGEQPTAEQKAIYNDFDSYAELSPSGRGVHIIVRGKVPTVKRQGIEVYSSGRFMTVTGNAVRPGPIADQSAKLLKLWERMGGNASQIAQDVPSGPQMVSDDVILDRASKAANGAKFAALYAGNWQSEYPSQSEADQAIVNIIAFYTKNREQITHIFRASVLGQRDKAMRDDYVNRMIDKAFDRDNALPKVSIQLHNPSEKPTENEAHTFNLGELLQRATNEPDTQFTTEYITPIDEVTLLSGNGGVGKSMLALQWGVSISAGRQFCGLNVIQAPVLFVSAEDRAGVCAKRLAAICADMYLLMPNQFTKQVQGIFHFWEILGELLWVEDKANAAGVPTLTMFKLEKCIAMTGAKQVFIDNANSIFCANHNDNVQVTAFISHMRQMAKRTNCNILIIAHVSADNATKGTAKTYYGSTAWHNGVRSRIFMELKPAQDGIDEHISVIHEKSNYGKLAEPFKLQRNAETGILRLLSNHEIAQAIDENISNIASQVFADIKAIFEKGEYVVVSAQGSTNFYSCLSNHFPDKYREGDRKTKYEAKLAIQRLADSKLLVKQSRRTGNRNATTVWVPVLPMGSRKP